MTQQPDITADCSLQWSDHSFSQEFSSQATIIYFYVITSLRSVSTKEFFLPSTVVEYNGTEMVSSIQKLSCASLQLQRSTTSCIPQKHNQRSCWITWFTWPQYSENNRTRQAIWRRARVRVKGFNLSCILAAVFNEFGGLMISGFWLDETLYDVQQNVCMV